jgi:hypothetical protein
MGHVESGSTGCILSRPMEVGRSVHTTLDPDIVQRVVALVVEDKCR